MSDTTHEHDVEDRRKLVARGYRIAPGWRFSEAVAPDGSTSFWMIAEDAQATDDPLPPLPDHEQLGPLPRETRLRLGLRCSAVKKKGRQCRNTVPGFGGRCAAHSEDPEATP